MTEPALRPRQVIIGPCPSGKMRPGVVLAVRGAFVDVALGTGSHFPSRKHVRVAEDTPRWWRSFRDVLHKPTYFYRRDFATVRAGVLKARRANVPIDLWTRIKALEADEDQGEPQIIVKRKKKPSR